MAATPGTLAFAQTNKYQEFRDSSDPMLPQASIVGGMELKTFWSPVLNDTLTTASPEGLAWAAIPTNGYTLQRVEGNCHAMPQPGGGKLVQMWSGARQDSYLVIEGGSHYQTALQSKYSTNWTECYTSSGSSPGKWVPGGTGKWTVWPSVPQPGMPWPVSKDLVGWEYLSGANPGYEAHHNLVTTGGIVNGQLSNHAWLFFFTKHSHLDDLDMYIVSIFHSMLDLGLACV